MRSDIEFALHYATSKHFAVQVWAAFRTHDLSVWRHNYYGEGVKKMGWKARKALTRQRRNGMRK